jgi:hypothetical protein
LASVLCCIFAILVHLAAGLAEEGKVVASPNGPIGLLVILAWLLAFSVSAITITCDWRRPVVGIVTLLSSVVGFEVYYQFAR